MTVETLAPALGLKERELPACVVRESHGEIAIEWTEFAATGVFAVMTEAMLASGSAGSASARPALGRVRFCARALPSWPGGG
jgi:hypothetical protein